MTLGDELLKLEQQAATVASYLHDADEELLQEVADGWAPMPDGTRYSTPVQRARWRRDWVRWVLECGERWEARPAEPSVDDLHQVIMSWVLSHSH
mgnify:CR=1 FL=1